MSNKLKPKKTLKEIMNSGKLSGVHELNSQIRTVVKNRGKGICKYCDTVTPTCSRGEECAAFKFLMDMVEYKPRSR